MVVEMMELQETSVSVCIVDIYIQVTYVQDPGNFKPSHIHALQQLLCGIALKTYIEIMDQILNASGQ